MRTRYRWKLLTDLDAWLEKPMLALSVIWLVLVVAELSGIENALVTLIGTLIWIIFILEFVLRLVLAPEKWRFLRRNWITVIALFVPALRLLRIAVLVRAAAFLRGARLVRIVGTVNRSMNALGRTLSRRGFGYVLLLTLVVLLTGAAGMLNFEPASQVHGGFTSYWHALWWTGMLLASLGTDFWPQTVEGRLLSSLLALYGLAVFGYITATFASFFIDRDAATSGSGVAGTDELRRIRAEIASLRDLVRSN